MHYLLRTARTSPILFITYLLRLFFFWTLRKKGPRVLCSMYTHGYAHYVKPHPTYDDLLQ